MELTTDSGDLVTLELQRLFAGRHADPAEVLLRIDYRQEAKTAPFQFDMVHGKLHRSGCGSIPADCTPALYAVWAPGEELERVACHRCRPSGAEAATMKQDPALDVLFGLISIVDQFGSVLKERGKEYRSSAKGRKLAEDLDGMFSALDETQRDALRVTVASLDGLVKAVEAANRSTGQNGQAGGAAHRNGNQRKKKEGV
jgi:hypothetical protein